MLDEVRLHQEFRAAGHTRISQVVDDAFISQMKKETFEAIEKESEYHGSSDYYTYGVVTMPPIYGGTFVEIFTKEAFNAPFNSLLGEGCIAYTINTSCIPPNKKIFTTRIHVDSPRIIENYVTFAVGMLLLDDFTEENGATWLLPGSQTKQEMPSEEEFYSKAIRCIGKSGDLFVFDPRIWHAGGENKSDNFRSAFLVGMIRPWMKQRIDIPRFMEKRGIMEADISPIAAQKLGFHSQVPANYDEFFVPPEQRKFKQKVV